MKRTFLFAPLGAVTLALSVLLGCPGAGIQAAGNGTVTGDKSWKVGSVIGFLADGGGTTGFVGSAVVLTDATTNCSDITSRNSIPYASHSLLAVMDSLEDDSLSPGVFDVSVDAGTTRIAAVDVKNANGDVDQASDGTVTFTAASSTQLVGSFDLQMQGATSGNYALSGTFTAPVCPTFSPF